MGALEIPLFSNSVEDVHCVQAAIQMVLKHFFPTDNYSLEELDKITNHQSGGWTWNTSVYTLFANFGFEVVVIDDFDFRRFSTDGESYLKSIWPQERFRLESLNANLHQEQEMAERLLSSGYGEKVKHQQRSGTNADIRRLFRDGYVVVPNVNPYSLDDEEGFCGHYVVITSVGKKSLTFNDPGLPAIKNRRVSWGAFGCARTENPNLFAVRVI